MLISIFLYFLTVFGSETSLYYFFDKSAGESILKVTQLTKMPI